MTAPPARLADPASHEPPDAHAPGSVPGNPAAPAPGSSVSDGPPAGPRPAVRTGDREWQAHLIELLAKLEHHRLQLAGTRLGPDADYVLDKCETLVQLAEDLAKRTTFAEASAAAEMDAMAKTGAAYVCVNDARRPGSRSLFQSVLAKFAADGTQTPAVREAVDRTVDALHAYCTLFTGRYPSSLAARGWVDAASAFLADLRQMQKDWPEA